MRISQIEVPKTTEGLARIALIRREELDGFVDGLSGNKTSWSCRRAHRAINVLSELRAIFDGISGLASDPTKPTTADLRRSASPVYAPEVDVKTHRALIGGRVDR